jgi:hypothetical protein
MVFFCRGEPDPVIPRMFLFVAENQYDCSADVDCEAAEHPSDRRVHRQEIIQDELEGDALRRASSPCAVPIYVVIDTHPRTRKIEEKAGKIKSFARGVLS